MHILTFYRKTLGYKKKNLPKEVFLRSFITFPFKLNGV